MFKGNKFYSHNAFVFFVQVLKSTAFVSLYNIKWRLFKVQCFACEVGSELFICYLPHVFASEM